MTEQLILWVAVLGLTLIGGFLAWILYFKRSGEAALAEQRQREGPHPSPWPAAPTNPAVHNRPAGAKGSPLAIGLVLGFLFLVALFAGVGALPFALIALCIVAALYKGIRALRGRRPIEP
jgi:predicted lipid-binding transport protein (Tim44 family)